MILSGLEIEKQVKAGRITINPFRREQINPNSYNYRLGKRIKIIPDNVVLDPRRTLPFNCEQIPDSGIVLNPGCLYLGETMETIGSKHFVPSLMGRSSIGRLGLYLHLSADLGHLGFAHSWTLELVAIQPIRIYPEMVIGQVSFWSPWGRTLLYDGKYVDQDAPTESRLPLDLD